MTNLFQPDVPGNSEVTIPEKAYEALVGDDKKYKDNEALAKAAFHKDAFIETLKGESKSKDAEIQRLKDDLQTRVSMQDFIKEMKERELPDDPPHVPSRTPEKVETVDIDKLLDDKLQQLSKKAQIQQNITAVEAELTKLWGPAVRQKLSEKARELSVSPEFLQSIAESSPKAFLELVRPQAQTQNDNLLPASTVRPTGNTGTRNYAWYEREMKKDKRLRIDDTFQQQMHRDAMKMGEKFFE